MMIREQDQAIDSIAGTLNTIQQQASLMGQEINVHNECVEIICRQSSIPHISSLPLGCWVTWRAMWIELIPKSTKGCGGYESSFEIQKRRAAAGVLSFS